MYLLDFSTKRKRPYGFATVPGDVYGKWIVLKKANKKQGRLYWLCKCKCGNEKVVFGTDLRRGNSRSCGKCKHTKIQPGDIFERLTVIKRASRGNCNQLRWLCKCKCGEESISQSSSLQSGHATSCGCYQKERTIEANRLNKGESGFNRLYDDYQRKADDSNHEFSLTKNEFRVLTKCNCHYCGKKPSQKKIPNRGGEHAVYTYNGIDRFNHSLGYILSNCVPCCEACNRMKAVYELIDSRLSNKNPESIIKNFLDHIQAIATHQKNLALKPELI